MINKISNKTLYSPIVAPKSPATQGFSPKYHEGDRASSPIPDFQKLNSLILDKRLFESLDMLEQCGFWGESGLTVIKFMQEEGAA